MKTLNFLVSLPTEASDFQREQAKAAQEAAGPLGVKTKIIYAQDDAIAQCEQLLNVIQCRPGDRPDAIIVQPCGRTGLPQVARAAASHGIGWAVLNSISDYLPGLRADYRVPAFALSSNQDEIGRIQGRQMAALLPQGGSVLYIQGPSSSIAAMQRTAGMNETKPANIVVRLLKSDNWTEEGGIRAVTTWLRLPTAHKDRIDLIMGQSDLLALGARDKLIMQSNMGNTLFAGVDGLLDGGQKWVQKGSLTATIIVPTTAGIAIEQMANALRGGIEAPEMTFTVPVSYPSIEALRKNASSHQLAHAVGRK